jgi:hypothetical protein
MTTVVLNTTTRKIEAFSSARDVQARAYGHDSKAALEAATVPAGIPLLFLRSYAVAGDGGAANYKRVASEPMHAGKIQSADGAWWEIAEPVHNVRMFGATGDGSTDDTTAINNAVEAAALRSVGRVHIPAGVYIISSGIGGESNLSLTGDGIGSTTIKRAASTAAFNMTSWSLLSNFSIRDLTFDGNANNQTDLSGHGIRMNGVSEFYIGNVRIVDTCSYGIGIQTSDAHKRGIIESVWIERSGSDGIDIKNLTSANEAIIINNVIVVDPGMRKTLQAGIDVRGPTHLSNITVLLKTTTNDSGGIRFRFGIAGTGNGLGGVDCSLTNFYVKADPALAGPFGHGVNIGQSGVKISNGHVINMARGVLVDGDATQCVIEGVTARACTQGFEDKAADNTWIGCKAHDNVGDGFRLNASARTQLIGCEATGNDEGFAAVSSPADMVLVGCRSSGNTTADWVAITASTAQHLIGLVNYPFTLAVSNGAGVKQFEIGTTASPVNHLRLSGGATGNPPILSAQGSDTNVDAQITPKGTGRVRFGTHAALAGETVTGYIEIKDDGGTVRKIAVVS